MRPRGSNYALRRETPIHGETHRNPVLGFDRVAICALTIGRIEIVSLPISGLTNDRDSRSYGYSWEALGYWVTG